MELQPKQDTGLRSVLLTSETLYENVEGFDRQCSGGVYPHKR
ncbi:hypothetical protein D1AOALGA4SA_10034 [Olavius algarvensis Delta 1 endosymbiont]|nr:hypothetical protein D1AOALGA4SA_10034 [Olavius algarvensis Delta 1 endosymbiont]